MTCPDLTGNFVAACTALLFPIWVSSLCADGKPCAECIYSNYNSVILNNATFEEYSIGSSQHETKR